MQLPHAKPAALIVDDEPGIRELIGVVLQEAGYVTLSACGASEALELSGDRTNRIDVMITEAELRDGSGMDLAQEIHNARNNMAVVIMCGSRECRERARTGDYTFLPKPFSVDELLDAVGRTAARTG